MSTQAFFDYLYLRTDPQAPTLLHTLGADPSSYVVYTGYEVCAVNFDSELGGTVLGVVDVQIIRLAQAKQNQVPWVAVMDCNHSDLAELHDLMFHPHDAFLADFQELMGHDAQTADVCYLAEDSILDKSWGPHVLHAVLQHHSHAGFFVTRVQDLDDPDATETERFAARSRSATLLAMGFTRCPDTAYFFFNLAYVIPPLPVELRMRTLLDLSDAPQVMANA